MKWRPYSAYKPSGVEWLGDVPEHWEVKRLKYLATINDETLSETTSPDFEFSYIDIGSVDSVKGIVATEDKIFETAPSRARRIVRMGDTIVSTVRTYLRAIAPIRTQQSNMIVSTGFAVVRPRSIDQGFMSYALRECGFIDAIVARSVGVSYPAVNASEIGTIPVPFPSADEQTAIADFLDRETTRIDTLVAKKQTLIERLKEKRGALISRTVTRGLPPDEARKAGLDPHPKLKPSGIDWLGDVPEHWGTSPLKYFATIKTGYAFSSDDFTEEGIPILRIGDITKDGKIDFSNAKYLPSSYNNKYRDILVKYGDIVMAMTGATIGKAGRFMFDEPALLNQRVCIFCPLNQNNQNYLWYILNSNFYIKYIDLTAFGGAQPNISDTELLDCFIPAPPTPEQIAIAEFLDRETTKIDKLITKIETAIERLREYRTALITAAVTGKIDVRSAAS